MNHTSLLHTITCLPEVTAYNCSGLLALCPLDGVRVSEAVLDAGERAALASTSRAWSQGAMSPPPQLSQRVELCRLIIYLLLIQDELAEPAAVCQLITAGTLEDVLDAGKRAALPRIDLPRLAAILPKYRHAPARSPKAQAARLCGRVSGVV